MVGKIQVGWSITVGRKSGHPMVVRTNTVMEEPTQEERYKVIHDTLNMFPGYHRDDLVVIVEPHCI